jgi:hypothetical protein
MAGFQAIASCDLTRINFKRSSLNIDRHDLAMITFFDLWANLRLINLITPSSKLFFAVAGLGINLRRDKLYSGLSGHFGF